MRQQIPFQDAIHAEMGGSVSHIMKRLNPRTMQNVPPKPINYVDIVVLSQHISEQKTFELQDKLKQLTQSEQEDQALSLNEQAKAAQFQQKRQEMARARLEILNRKSLIEQEINFLDASRRVLEGGKASVEHDQEFLGGGYFTALLAQVAQEDYQIEMDAGADKLSAHINLLQQAKRPAEATLAQYIARLNELDQEIRVYDADISSQTGKIKKAQMAIDQANKELSELVNQNMKLAQQFTVATDKLLQHNAGLDASIYKVTQEYEAEYQQQLQRIQDHLEHAQHIYDMQKAGAEGARIVNIKDSTDELNRQVEHARNTIKKTCHRRERNGNSGFPRWETRWRDVYWEEFDPDRFNQEKARLEGEHNNRVHQANVTFNETMTGPNNVITAARTTANNSKAQLAANRQANLNAKLDQVTKNHRNESERLAVEVAHLKPLVDRSQADVQQKQQTITSLVHERNDYQQVLDQVTAHRRAASGRKDENNIAKQRIERQIQEMDQEITQARAKLPAANNAAASPQGQAEIKFDKAKYEKLLNDLCMKRLELKQVNQQLTEIDNELQQLSSQAVLNAADDAMYRAHMNSSMIK